MVYALSAPAKAQFLAMQIYLDRFAIVLSSICAIHCVALPLIASILPLLSVTVIHGNALHEFWFHHFILIFILPISLFALIAGYRCHRQLVPIFVGAIGLLVLVFTAITAETLIAHRILPNSGETILTILGGIIHATGHVLNLIAARSIRTQCIIK